MKAFVTLLTIYVLAHSAQGDSPRYYDGLSQTMITELLAAEGKTAEFVTKKAYDQAVSNISPAPVDPDRIQAKIDLNNQAKTDAERIEAIIKYLALDR